jgi:uncharacterized protein (TIGR03663 family)
VAVVALLGVGLRLFGLGARPFHWDEARVGYWSLRFLHTGAFEYRPVAGGPFLYVVERFALPEVGATDFGARLPVAVVGGLAPLAALLFRERLSGTGVFALAVALAVDPVLLYYGRFLRGDVPLAAFALLTVGLVVRLADTGRRRYLYGAAVAFALALSTSAFAVGVVACWLTAAALTFDHARLFGDGDDARARLSALGRSAAAWATPLARAFLLWFVTVVFLFAPRGDGVGLWNPATLPAAVEAATTGAVRKFFGVRVADRAYEAAHPLIPYVLSNAELLAVASLSVVALALGAFLHDRYWRERPRPVVAFCAYWGFVGLLVFPVVTEVDAPWVAVHVVAPLSVPAAAAVASLVGHARDAGERGDAATVAAVALVLLAAVAQVGVVAGTNAYGQPTPDDALVDYAQPADDVGEVVERAERADEGPGTDLLYYGSPFHLEAESAADAPPVPDEWGNRLPLPWYAEAAGVETESATALEGNESVPPVVVAKPGARDALSSRLDGYESEEYRTALWERRVVVFYDPNRTA